MKKRNKLRNELRYLYSLSNKRMSKLTFNRVFYEKYITSSINILRASLKPDDCEILQINNTEYGYRRAVVNLFSENVIIMKRLRKS